MSAIFLYQSSSLLGCCFFFLSLCQCSLEFPCILQMFCVTCCETMGTVKCRRCAEIQVIVLVRIQDSLQAGFRWHIDRCWRETFIYIGIIRRVNLQVLFQDAVRLVVMDICNGRVGLEPHSYLVAVQVDARDDRVLLCLECLPADD